VVARHNAEDVITLGRLLAHLERDYGAGEVRRRVPGGDLIGLARLYRHEDRVEAAIECLRVAGETVESGDPDGALATVELARLLRREGRVGEAALAWTRLVDGDGALAALGWIELAKEREHRERDLAGAWDATDRALMKLHHCHEPGHSALRRGLEADLAGRRARLARRLERARVRT
jgi:hypothetical protein